MQIGSKLAHLFKDLTSSDMATVRVVILANLVVDGQLDSIMMSWGLGYPNSDPNKVENDESSEQHRREIEQCPQSLVKAGRRLLGEMDALNPDTNCECT